MSEQLYNVCELATNGWDMIDKRVDHHLTKEQANSRLEHYIGEGYSPDRLRAFPQD